MEQWWTTVQSKRLKYTSTWLYTPFIHFFFLHTDIHSHIQTHTFFSSSTKQFHPYCKSVTHTPSYTQYTQGAHLSLFHFTYQSHLLQHLLHNAHILQCDFMLHCFRGETVIFTGTRLLVDRTRIGGGKLAHSSTDVLLYVKRWSQVSWWNITGLFHR